MQSLITRALCSGLLQALQQSSLPLRRRLALVALRTLALLALVLGRMAGWITHRQRRRPSQERVEGANLAAAATAGDGRSNPTAEPSALLLPGGPAPGPAVAVVVPASIRSQQQVARLQRLIAR